jgi:AcrR family transcriptional regulator
MVSVDDSAPERPRRGRRPGTGGTRQVILDAARARFATEGYGGTTIRRVAADAGVDPALVMQYFGSKELLFGAVMSISPDVMARISEAFDGPEDALGERVTRAYLQLFEGDPRHSEPLIAMLRGAITRTQAADLLREFIQARLVHDARPAYRGDSDMVVRVGLAASMLVGVVMARRILRVPALMEEDFDTLVGRLAPAVHTVLTPGRARG